MSPLKVTRVVKNPVESGSISIASARAAARLVRAEGLPGLPGHTRRATKKKTRAVTGLIGTTRRKK